MFRVLLVDRRSRGVERFHPPCVFVVLVSLILTALLAAATESRAFDLSASRSPEEASLAMDRPVFSLLFESPSTGRKAGSWSATVGECRLFGDAGLSVSVCGAEVRRRGWACGVTGAVVSSPIGDEAAIAASILAPVSGRVRLAGGLRWNRVGFAGFERAHLVCVSLHALVRISPYAALCPGVEDVRVGGERLPGADASFRAAFFPEERLCGIGGLTVSRSGDVRFGVGSRLRLAPRVFLAVGYEDATGALTGSLSMAFRSAGLEAGASVHPVLGVSEALFVSWRK